MNPELKARIIAYNKENAVAKEKAEDLVTFLSALPPGQVKKLMNNEICGAILRKYGLKYTEE